MLDPKLTDIRKAAAWLHRHVCDHRDNEPGTDCSQCIELVIGVQRELEASNAA